MNFVTVTAKDEQIDNVSTIPMEIISLNNRQRFIAKQGLEYINVKLSDIAYFFSQGKLIFLIDKEKRKFVTGYYSLSAVKEIIKSDSFYQVNRKYLINVDYILYFKPYKNSQILMELKVPTKQKVIISQERAVSFRRWINGL